MDDVANKLESLQEMVSGTLRARRESQDANDNRC